MTAVKPAHGFVFSLDEISGAAGDLGTLLPLMLGAISVAGLAPGPVLAGFAAFYIATGLYYRLPIPVQPMKAVAAVLVTTAIAPGELAVSGVMIGICLVVLGATGWINRLARLVPQSVLAGLQVGLGLSLGLVSLKLLGTAPVAGIALLIVLIATTRLPKVPSALLVLVLAMVLGSAFGLAGMPAAPQAPGTWSLAAFFAPQTLYRALSQLALPQLALTFTNAVILTALMAKDYFGERAGRVTPGRLAVTSGLANLLLAPLGAMPMCHGAGGLAAHYRFGARSGAAPVMLGLVLAALALLPHGLGPRLLAAIPAAGLGVLLIAAAWQLAISKRLFDARPSCWPVIAATAIGTVWAGPLAGLIAGTLAELVRLAALKALRHA